MPPAEFVIVGQGLAGTALAWALLRRGRGVRVVDDDRGGASRLAAGLITPVTGKRLAKSWRWDELYPAAVAFYRAIETATGASFFHQRPALRVFASADERDEYHRRAEMLRALVRQAEVPDGFAAPFGGFEMPSAARLDVPRYLDAAREHFRAKGIVFTSPLEGEVGEAMRAGWGESAFETPGRLTPHPPPAKPGGDLPLKGGGEEVTTIDCRGYAPDSGLRFNAAKGEILTVRVPGLAEPRVVHRGIWLSPVGDNLYRAGATYTHDPLDTVPTPEGRAEIEAKLRAFLTLPFEVLDHRAAVRPVIDAGFPVLGRHPTHPQLAYFNGLGSKGSLLAPFFAEQLAAHLCGDGHIEDGVNVARFLVHSPPARG